MDRLEQRQARGLDFTNSLVTHVPVLKKKTRVMAIFNENQGLLFCEIRSHHSHFLTLVTSASSDWIGSPQVAVSNATL
jgi:hypothetical protein